MNANVELVPHDAPAEDAWRRMQARRIHHLVVVEGDAVVGILSDRDLAGRRGAAWRAEKTVADVMTRHVQTAKPSTTVLQAANLLRGYQLGCLPVFDGKKLAGIVTVSDLLNLIGRGVERPQVKTKRWTLKHRGPRRRVVVRS